MNMCLHQMYLHECGCGVNIVCVGCRYVYVCVYFFINQCISTGINVCIHM